MNITRREMIAGSVASIASLAIPVKASENKNGLFIRGEIAMLGVDTTGYSFSKECLKSMVVAINAGEKVIGLYRGKTKIKDSCALYAEYCGDGNAIQVVAAIYNQEFLRSGVDILNNNWWLVPACQAVFGSNRVCSQTKLDYLILTQYPSDRRLFPIHKYK